MAYLSTRCEEFLLDSGLNTAPVAYKPPAGPRKFPRAAKRLKSPSEAKDSKGSTTAGRRLRGCSVGLRLHLGHPTRFDPNNKVHDVPIDRQSKCSNMPHRPMPLIASPRAAKMPGERHHGPSLCESAMSQGNSHRRRSHRWTTAHLCLVGNLRF